VVKEPVTPVGSSPWIIKFVEVVVFSG
jgi:hypothetical protein